MPTSNHRRFVAVLCLVTLAACSGNGDGDESYRFVQPELTATVTDGVLNAVVPSEGGVVVGPTGTEFEGVLANIPAGALPGGTVFTISAGTEGDPLPDFAERVGAQFTFGPTDPPLAAPVEVTLPVREESLDQLATNGDAVQVWLREGDAWSLQDATASSETAVTLSLAALSTAAAGVKTSLSIPRCTSCPEPACPSTGPCVENLGVLPVPPSTASFTGMRFVGSASTLAYVGTQNGADVGVKIALPASGSATGSLGATLSQPVIGTSACCLSAPLLDEDGSLLVTRSFEGAGFTRLRFGAGTQLEGTAVPGRPVGVVRMGFAPARVTRNGLLNQNNQFLTFPIVNRIDSFSQLTKHENGFVALSDAGKTRMRTYAFDGSAGGSDVLPGNLRCASKLAGLDPVSGETKVACLSTGPDAPTGTISRCRFSVNSETCDTYFSSSALQFVDLGYDPSGGLWLTSVDTTEVIYLSPSLELSSVNLQTALPTVGAQNLLARDVLVVDATTAIVVTSSNRVIRIRRQ